MVLFMYSDFFYMYVVSVAQMHTHVHGIRESERERKVEETITVTVRSNINELINYLPESNAIDHLGNFLLRSLQNVLNCQTMLSEFPHGFSSDQVLCLTGEH